MFKIPVKEFQGRVDRMLTVMDERGLDAVYLSTPINLRYFVGFGYLPTERPAAIVVPKRGEICFFGPLIERDHLLYQTQLVGRAFNYLDYPGEIHPMKLFASWLSEIGLSGKTIGVDNPAFYSSPYGYRGPPLSELVHDTLFRPIGEELSAMRVTKSPNELACIRESVKWGEVAHSFLQKYLMPGVYDFEASAKASLDASLKMKKELGEAFRASSAGPFLAHAGIRGQVGPNSAYPHSVSIERAILKGDVIVTGAASDVDGYHSELERNLFMGEPDERTRKLHKIALEMQRASFNALKPGARCSDADKASYKVAKEYGVTEYLRHHSGHGMGLEGHEPPFLDVGDDTIVRPGMVFSCEPGIYVPGQAGFRHSDTVIVTEDSTEWVNKYPSDTESLIIPC
ncbi:MAG: Xaa-Pro peptidase family protein [Thermoprotei archaeon]